MKKWWKSKTIWFNAAVAAGSAVASQLGIDLGALSTAVVPLIAAINVLLRGVTSKPIR